jgi:hypothetical protein
MMPGTYNGARAPPVMSLFGGHCGAANRRHPRTASQNLRAVSQRSSSRRLLRYLIDRSDKGARSRHSRKFRPHIPPQLLNTGLIALAPSPKRRRSSTDETPHGAGALSFGSLRDSIPAHVRVLKRELNSVRQLELELDDGCQQQLHQPHHNYVPTSRRPGDAGLGWHDDGFPTMRQHDQSVGCRADTPCLLGRQVSDAEPCSWTDDDYWLLSMRRSESFVGFPALYHAERWPLLHATASIKL